MSVSPLMLVGLLLPVAVAVLLFMVTAMNRHRKGASVEIKLVGATASVETTLGPEGTVFVGGELWPARSLTGATLPHGLRVRVVGASAHLLQVEAAE